MTIYLTSIRAQLLPSKRHASAITVHVPPYFPEPGFPRRGDQRWNNAKWKGGMSAHGHGFLMVAETIREHRQDPPSYLGTDAALSHSGSLDMFLQDGP
ncbi:uncharacterized protein B0T23DRAFT_400538 [Neurospora hispaniola]|uniref:Uncharacterized protein n=1 Tax=Neurospora hispaniola TaxID=588809 RepID=A0AAJ0MUL9_9PEZI|nr:hypothetical protein B0T23DRAFT_400538 [Neurospora hispaniola]